MQFHGSIDIDAEDYLEEMPYESTFMGMTIRTGCSV